MIHLQSISISIQFSVVLVFFLFVFLSVYITTVYMANKASCVIISYMFAPNTNAFCL